MLSILTLYVILFVSSFLASTVLPMSSDAIVAYMASKHYGVLFIISVASLGSFLGSCTTYFLCLYGREKFIEKHIKIKKETLIKSKKMFEKYGAPSLLLTWIPFIGDAFIVVSGILGINFLTFSAYSFIGKIFKYSIIVYIVSFV